MVADAQVAASVREKAAEAAADAAAAPPCAGSHASDDGKIDAFIINSRGVSSFDEHPMKMRGREGEKKGRDDFGMT